MEQTDITKEAVKNLVDYPDNHYRLLTSYLSKLYGVNPKCIVIGSGLENMIDILSRAILTVNDKYLLPTPNFSLFEEFSSRTGAIPVFVQLNKENRYQWTSATADEIINCIKNLSPKILWMSNPVNPTGQFIEHEMLEKIIAEANRYNCIVVVDEAYGEYTDQDNEFNTCIKFIDKYPNLVVLRTLSKIFGLPSIRIGYMATKNPDIIEITKLYRQVFPFSWFSLFVGQIALVDQEYPALSRKLNIERRTRLFQHLDQLDGYEYLKSETCVFLLKSKTISGGELVDKLESKGYFVANHNLISGIKGENYVRLTVQNDDDNNCLVETLKNLNG